jgi:predicted Rossmann fold nucleotide-binding protein DprA/Smf involved in DNA uptake
MKKPESQLKSIAKNLAALADKLEKISAQVESTPAKTAKAAPKKAAEPKKAVSKPKKKGAAKKQAPAPAAAAETPKTGKDTVLESVYDVISKSRNGATIANLRSKTGLESRQLSNALYKLGKKGQIKTISRGVYVKA